LYAWLVQNGYKTSLHRPSCDAFHVDNHDMPIEVEIVNHDACKRYACLSITGCDVKESPEWLQNKLRVIGLRPINNIVDITNYIMMAYGQPMHCFDADMVKGHKIVVRTQPEGTKFVTLDGEEHTLGEHDLSICNSEEPMCIAGIFGGKGSGTYDTTRNVVLESAYFHPTWIRKSARRHGLSTDSSYRFERGIDPEGVIYALKQAAILCKELAGGKVSMEINDVYPEAITRAEVSLSYDYCNKLIGKKIGHETIKNICRSLEMTINAEDEQGLRLSVPAYRVDVQRPCDVVEDILRIYGYNNVEIPTELKSCLTIQADEDKKEAMQNLVSEQLVGCGFNEIMNNSLSKTSYYAGLNHYTEETTVKVMNPLSQDLGVMRQTLFFGGMESIKRNVNRKRGNLKFFEVGNCYHYTPEKKNEENPVKAYREESHLAFWLTGKRVEGSWTHADEQSTVYELKAYVMNTLRRLGVPIGMLVSAKSDNNLFAEGEELKKRGANAVLCEYGVVSIDQLKAFDIQQPVFYADINWDIATALVSNNKVEFKELGKYPAVSRDLALLLDKSVAFGEVERIARQTEKKLLKRVELFDVYEGKNLPAGKKSYAVNFILQDEEKTLTDKQIESIMQKLQSALCKGLNAELR